MLGEVYGYVIAEIREDWLGSELVCDDIMDDIALEPGTMPLDNGLVSGSVPLGEVNLNDCDTGSYTYIG